MTENKEPKTDAAVGAEKPIAATAMPDDSPACALAERAAWHLLEKKAEDVVVLDLRGRSDVCDFFVIATGNSDTQVRALAKRWVKDTWLDAGQQAHGPRGPGRRRAGPCWTSSTWWSTSSTSAAREYFQLERLWGDAGRLDLAPAWFAADGAAERHPDLNFATAAGPGGSERG